MKCPKCGSTKIVVPSTVNCDNYIRRRRKCNECSYRFTTYEMIMTVKEFKEGNK